MCSRPRHRRRCHRPASAPRVTPPGLLVDLGLQLHMLAILLLSAHFRKIVRGIDKMINGGGAQEQADRRASTSRFSLTGNPNPNHNHPLTANPTPPPQR